MIYVGGVPLLCECGQPVLGYCSTHSQQRACGDPEHEALHTSLNYWRRRAEAAEAALIEKQP